MTSITGILKNPGLRKRAAVGSVALILSSLFVLALRPSPNLARDFFQDYAAARNFQAGKPVYRPLDQSVHDYLGQQMALGVVLNDAHPPASVLLAIPLAHTDYVRASILWSCISLMALTVSLRILLTKLNYNQSTSDLMLLLVALVVWPPLWYHITCGQFGLLLLLLLTLAWSAGRAGRDAWAGSLVGLAAAVKIFPAALLLPFILRRRWRAVIAGVFSFILLNCLAVAIEGADAFRQYLALLPSLARFRAQSGNSSLTGFFSRLSNPRLSSFLILIGSALIVAFIAREASRKPADFDHEFALTLTATLLLCPLTWQHSFVLLLLPLAVCMARFQDASPSFRYLLVAGWVLMAVPEPLLPGFDDGPSAARSLGVLSLNFYGLVAFFIAQTACHTGYQVQGETIEPVEAEGLA